MVDKITNSIVNLENKASKNSTNVKNSLSKVDNYVGENTADIQIENKKVIEDLASSAPIDHDKVSSIKKAISSGNYPLDLDKISDALMDAYNDMKSWCIVIWYEFFKKSKWNLWVVRQSRRRNDEKRW